MKISGAVKLAMLIVGSAWNGLIAEEIPGKVQEAGKDEVKIASDSAFLPNPGDKLEIYFQVPGIDEPVQVATGTVSDVQGGAILAKIDRALGKVSAGQLVRITSPKPRSRQPSEPTGAAIPVAGGFDPEFGSQGKVVTEVGPRDAYARAMIVQADGRIVVAGRSERAPQQSIYDLALVRYLSDGRLDPLFGNGGIATVALGNFDVQVNALVAQADGSLVVGGAVKQRPNAYDWCVLRILPNGAPDLQFGENGRAITNLGSGNNESASCTAVAVQPGGRIIAAGNAKVGGRNYMSVVGYTPEGRLDNTFGQGGRVQLALGDGDGYASALTVASDGAFHVAGNAKVSGQDNLVVTRFRAEGVLDKDFARDGAAVMPIGSLHAAARAITILPDGKVVAAGYAFQGEQLQLALVRFQSNGRMDETFASGGTQITPLGVTGPMAFAVAPLPRGKILVGLTAVRDKQNRFFLACFNGDGTIDRSFGEAGLVMLPVGGRQESAVAMSVQPGRGVILGGTSLQNDRNSFAVVKYLTPWAVP